MTVVVRPVSEGLPRPAVAAGTVASAGDRLDPIITITAASKRYGTGDGAVFALDRISLQVERGEFLCLVGASGCGKSTLLSLIAGLDAPTGGTVDVRGRVAFMFQEAALLPWRTAGQNVELALKLRGVARARRRERARELLLGDHGSVEQECRVAEPAARVRPLHVVAVGERALVVGSGVLRASEPKLQPAEVVLDRRQGCVVVEVRALQRILSMHA